MFSCFITLFAVALDNRETVCSWLNINQEWKKNYRNLLFVSTSITQLTSPVEPTAQRIGFKILVAFINQSSLLFCDLEVVGFWSRACSDIVYSQELHWCRLLRYFHHCHPGLHRAGYRGWVWHIAADYITQSFIITHKYGNAHGLMYLCAASPDAPDRWRLSFTECVCRFTNFSG